ncbi:hypothetical protein [Williamsia sterculiae]|uniref:Sensory transduction regulator n=1 Tax=Williamsia sterculiae TaxID=1344003 RepID=A0A1N7G7K6_9NOCA|nr:hypothetical protein [Williamsia sterculiae]SIS08396.1 hypothetical protein SAMN05445060_2561 [Williamsia sterculiae]
MSEPEDAATALINRAADLLTDVAEVTRAADGSLTLTYDGTRAAVRAVTLAPGLDVVSLTQVLAWDLPNTDELRADIERLAGGLSFGSVKRTTATDVTTDVLQHYSFPAGGLDDIPLLTVLHMVLASGSEMARGLTA